MVHAEYGFLRLSDGYVQISSIMPQKRNPVPLEHTRILASRALNEAQSVLGSLHSTPFADMNDAEDSLQPLVALAFTNSQRSLSLLAGALSEATFHTDTMKARAYGSFLTVTEAADTLVRECGVSFHAAHSIVSAVVHAATTDSLEDLARELHRRAQEQGLQISLAALQQALDPTQFVAIRAVAGGPAPAALNPKLDRAEELMRHDRQWLSAERGHLAETEAALQIACDALRS